MDEATPESHIRYNVGNSPYHPVQSRSSVDPLGSELGDGCQLVSVLDLAAALEGTILAEAFDAILE